MLLGGAGSFVRNVSGLARRRERAVGALHLGGDGRSNWCRRLLLDARLWLFEAGKRLLEAGRLSWFEARRLRLFVAA